MNEISDKPSWIQFWQGKFSRSFLTHKYWIIWFGIYLIPLFISYFFYQGNYSILTNYISDLGDPYNNPIGWPIWAFGHICLGLLYIPFIGYLWRELSKEPRKGFKPGMFFLILTGFGVFGLGAFPQFNYPGIDVLHVMDAAFFIAGSFFQYVLLDAMATKRTTNESNCCLGTTDNLHSSSCRYSDWWTIYDVW